MKPTPLFMCRQITPLHTAQPDTELAVPVTDQPRPRRSPKPNPKYSPEVYDLRYVGAVPRVKSRRSIRRAGM